MLDRYINLLKSGQVVAFPTETVYGLGADAWKPEAIRKVFEIKKRPVDNPLIVHIASREMLHQFTDKTNISEEVEQLMNAFWPGPLTLIFPKKSDVLDMVTAGLDTVAVRWPGHPLSQDLIARVGPLVAPSANSSGRPSPTRPEHVREDFGEHFPVVDAGETQIGLESTVLDVSETPFRLYRPGAIGQNQIENIIEQPVKTDIEKPTDAPPKSPGIKYTHYSPMAAVHWLNDEKPIRSTRTLYLLHTIQPDEAEDNIICFDENYEEMAHQLFDRFRQADRQNFQEVKIEPLSDEILKQNPLAEALKNRISKATG